MHVITFASTKGGVGKSTMAATATDGFIRRGDTVRVIDFDPQASLRKWAEPIAARTENLIVSKIEMGDDATFADHYNALVDLFEDETDWVVIDTAGSDDFRQVAALAISDLVICPSGPVEDELIGVQKTAAYLKHALSDIAPDVDPMDMLRVLYRRPIGFPNAKMNTMREVLFSHFGVVDEIHHAAAITSFLGQMMTTDESITAAKTANKDPKPFLKMQAASDRLTASLKGQFDV